MFKKQKENGISQRCLTQMAQKERGITLVALVITIVVLIILAGISLNLVLGQNGIVNRAKEGGRNYTNASAEEEAYLDSAETFINGFIGGEGNVEYASNESKVGYYADLNGDGQITVADDGIIFADLAVGASGTGLGVSYSLDAVTSGLKNYEESTATYEGTFGTQKWLKVANGSTGLDRFYVMALQNIDLNTHYWYYSACNDSEKTLITSDGIASTNVAVGRANTEAIMAVYGRATDQGGWGLKASGLSYTDMFDEIKTKYESEVGWFVPSKKEWAAFADATMTENKKVSSNYSSFELNRYYWTSSQDSSDRNFAWYANIFNGGFYTNYINYGYMYYVRLCTTF